jgi:hypothetical protein
MSDYNPLRWVPDIGMFATDRPINSIGKTTKGSCVHATTFCLATCYNNKLYRIYPDMGRRDIANEKWWSKSGLAIGRILREFLDKKSKPTQRVRLMTRGEGIKDASDIAKIKSICDNNPDTLFWLPTRAWRDDTLRVLIQRQLFPLKNLALNASLDPSTTPEEWKLLKANGWSTMFYGDDAMTTTPNGDRMFLCPKTHKKLKGHCSTCRAGCMGAKLPNYGKRTDVHLSQH